MRFSSEGVRVRSARWLLICGLVGVPALALGQTSASSSPPTSADVESDLSEVKADEEEADEEDQAEAQTAESKPVAPAAPEKPPLIRVETGAPRPPVQSVGVAAPPPPPPGTPPGPPTIKIGGGVLLLYMHPFGIAEDSKRQGIPTRKPVFEVFRANVLLDSKVGRYGLHVDVRIRDKRLRSFFDGTSWIEEAYGSFALIQPGSPTGPLTLKLGKTYAQFGRFFDYNFNPNLPLRDGIKFDANYGASLEGVLGAGTRFGAKYYAQYFVLDGGTNTSADGRDTISNAAPYSANPNGLARKRNMFVGRIEPWVSLTPVVTFKVAGSVQNFTADWGPTIDQGNVLRYGGDVSADVMWFGAFAEYIAQRGESSRTLPFGPAAAVDGATDPYGRPSAAARPARSTDKITYLVAGARVTVAPLRSLLRYSFSMGHYDNVTYPIADIPGVALPKVRVSETVHTPGISIALTQQLSIWVEYGRYKRHMQAATLKLPASAGGPRALPARDWLLDQQIFTTLHGTI